MPQNPSLLYAAIGGLVILTSALGVGPAFHPDRTFRGSSLNEWHTLGEAVWKAQNGEITGAAKSKENGGWLFLNQSFQDAAFYATFRCPPGCETGVLFRAEKTAQGTKGVYVSLAPGDIASFRVVLDAKGGIVEREPLRFAGGQMRIAPPPDPNAPPVRPPRPAAGASAGGPNLPIPPVVRTVLPDEWNRIEIILDANIIRSYVNDSGETAGGAADDDAGRYGPIALHVGGGEVHFKDIAYRDVGLKNFPPEQTSGHFRMQRLSQFYYAWGAAAADVNRDGIPDVIAGPYYYLGPDYTKSREIYLAKTVNPSDEYTRDCWMQFAGDFTGDGWPDSLTASFSGNPGVWLYVNPRGEARRWDKHLVVKDFQSEIAVLKDVDGDGKPELVYMADGFVRYAKPDPANPTGLWTIHTVSEKGFGTAHGIGAGDINGDGRTDIVNAYGWWEQPKTANSEEPWKYHSQAFSRAGRVAVGGSVMGIYDVNGDGLNDVVTVLQAHGFGLAWFEQKRDAAGNISFVEHMIADDFWTKNAGGVSFSEAHGTTFGDVDGDGIPDFIVGKRYWTHRDDYLDPDPYGDAVLYWYKTVRNPKAPGGAEFVPELINNRSGAGSDVLAADLNKDGVLDIVTATRFGTFIFWGRPRTGSMTKHPQHP